MYLLQNQNIYAGQRKTCGAEGIETKCCTAIKKN
jgi:hypothetical protein